MLERMMPTKNNDGGVSSGTSALSRVTRPTFDRSAVLQLELNCARRNRALCLEYDQGEVLKWHKLR